MVLLSRLILPAVRADLIFPEEAGDDTSSGGAGESNLTVDDDGSVELGASQGSDEKIVVLICWRAGVTDGNTVELETCRERGQTEVMVRSSLVDLTWIIRLETVHNLLLTEDLLSRHLLLGLGAGLVLHLPSVGLSSRFDLVCKLHFLTLHHVSGDIPQLGILSDLGD